MFAFIKLNTWYCDNCFRTKYMFY